MRQPPHLHASYWPADASQTPLMTTLGDLLRRVASEVPERTALVDAVAEVSKRRKWTYAELLATAERVARILLERFEPGERIAVCAPNRAEWLFLQHGLSLAGLVMVPLNPAYRTAELEFVLRSSKAAGIFFAERFRDNDLRTSIESLRDRLPGLRHAISLEAWPSFIDSLPSAGALPALTPTDTVQIQYTSGTTGFPKGACLHHVGVINTAAFVASDAGLADGGVWVNAMPMFHIGSNVTAGIGTLSRRGTHVLAPGFDAGLMLELIESFGGNITLAVPTMILDLLDHPQRVRRNLSSLRTLVSGATVVPVPLVRRAKEAFGCDFAILFGQTELSGNVTRTHLEDTDEDQSETVGQPLPQIEVKIVDPQSRCTQPLDTPGEICVRGYQTMRGYFGDENATRATIDADGWLRTGDLGTMDARGYLRIVGRMKDMIIRGGMKIYPREVEDVLFAHPEVAQASVVGVPDERWGEIVVAVVVAASPDAPPAPEDLHAYCRSRLAAHKTPALWFFTREYPLTPTGKVQKFALQEWIRGGRIVPAAGTLSSSGAAAPGR